MNLSALLRELYPAPPPPGLYLTLITVQLYAAAYPYAFVQPISSEDLLYGYTLGGLSDAYGIPELLYAHRQGLPPLPIWAVADA